MLTSEVTQVAQPEEPVAAPLQRPIVPKKSILEVEDLSVDFVTVDGRTRVLNNISFHADQGEFVGIVGESGSGKTTLGLAILRLLDSPPAQIVSGKISFNGQDVMKLTNSHLAELRGTGMNMIFQESLISLNPVYRVESQIEESLDVLERARKILEKDGAKRKKMISVLEELCLDQPELVLKKYPHELSGGMRQRIAIAMSIVEEPDLLILDEPTTGLDVYVQNRILQILKKLNRDQGLSMVLITHDLTIASLVCDRMYVMYAGRVMEVGKSDEILEKPLHPYSESLLDALPLGFENSPPLPVPSGDPPDLKSLPAGCKFNPQCPLVMDICRSHEPRLIARPDGRSVACWKYDDPGLASLKGEQV